jgi:hypothetical protein
MMNEASKAIQSPKSNAVSNARVSMILATFVIRHVNDVCVRVRACVRACSRIRTCAYIQSRNHSGDVDEKSTPSVEKQQCALAGF